MSLRKRAVTYLRWINSVMPVEQIAGESLAKCTNILTKNFQHVHRGVVEDVLAILREERTKSLSQLNGTMTLFVDNIVRKVRQL